MHGADFIRTHDPAALRDALRVTAALTDEAGALSDRVLIASPQPPPARCARHLPRVAGEEP